MMKTCLIACAAALSVISAPALANSPQRQVNRIVEPIQEPTKVETTGFAAPQEITSFSDMTGLPAAHYIEDALPEEGSYFDWFDQTGQRFEFERENGDIIVRTKTRATARIRVSDIEKTTEPQLGASAIAMRE